MEYVVAALVIGGFGWFLWSKIRKSKNDNTGTGGSGGGGSGPGGGGVDGPRVDEK